MQKNLLKVLDPLNRENVLYFSVQYGGRHLRKENEMLDSD